MEEIHINSNINTEYIKNIYVCACVCAEAFGDARPMITSHLWILCRYAAEVHISMGLRLRSGYHVPNRPVGVHIAAAPQRELWLYRGTSGDKW